jgi:hypothetical protein
VTPERVLVPPHCHASFVQLFIAEHPFSPRLTRRWLLLSIRVSNAAWNHCQMTNYLTSFVSLQPPNGEDTRLRLVTLPLLRYSLSHKASLITTARWFIILLEPFDLSPCLLDT